MNDSPNQRLGQAIEAQRDELAKVIVDKQWELDPELNVRYGEIGHAKCVQDVRYNLAYLAQAIASDSLPLFTNYVEWVKVLFQGLKIPTQELATSLEITGEILQQQFPDELGATTSQYIEVALRELTQSSEVVPSFISEAQPLAPLARQYLKALLQGERQVASRLILEAVDKGITVKEIYLYVFQCSQYEIGRLWQMNQVSVAQEHYCTAATQLIMSQLYPYIFATEKIGRRLVAACVGDELHELGLRMVADFFELEGWDTYYLGSNTPTPSILQAIAERQADVVAISATMTFHVNVVAELIGQIRVANTHDRVKILVGGYPFNIEPALWQTVRADGYARNAKEAIDVSNKITGEPGDEA